MSVIKKLGDRVEKEHDQFLRDSQRTEDRSGLATNGTNGTAPSQGIDFESLVGRSNVLPSTNGPTISIDTSGDENSWDDDGWGSMFNGTVSAFKNQQFH
jgi:SCY1-like protein 2